MDSKTRAVFVLGQLVGAIAASLWWAASRWGTIQTSSGLLWGAAGILTAAIVGLWLFWITDIAFPHDAR
jgi:hypothetical protein